MASTQSSYLRLQGVNMTWYTQLPSLLFPWPSQDHDDKTLMLEVHLEGQLYQLLVHPDNTQQLVQIYKDPYMQHE